VRDDTLFVKDVGHTTGKARGSSAIRLADNTLSIAQQWKGKARLVGKGFIFCHGVKANAKNLHAVLHKGVMEGTEPVPFRGSPTGVGFGIKPQHHFFPPQF
jgi:hypothetical protein